MKSPLLRAFECSTCDKIIETGDDVHIFGSQAICTECAKAAATIGCPFVI